MASTLALIDCNNFYAACEQAFDPLLQGRPVVVLSNNDGCIVARSREARQLGIGDRIDTDDPNRDFAVGDALHLK